MVIDYTVHMVKVEELTPYQKNAKKHPAHQIKLIAKSIAKFGFRYPLLVDENNIIVAGHGRFLAAQQLQLKEVPILYAKDLTEGELKAYRIADNKVGESGWDLPLVEEELLEIEEEKVEWLEEAFEFKEEDFGIKNSVSKDTVSFTTQDLRCPACGAEGPKKIFKKEPLKK